MGKKLQKKKKHQKQKRNPSLDRSSNHNYEISSAKRYNFEKEYTDDLFSTLPDDMLFRFLSFLPFEFALKTISLSRQWRGLWNMDLVKHGTKEDIACVVGDLLLNFDGFNPLRNYWRIQFHFNQGLILLATIGIKSKLQLDFSKGNQEFPNESWHLVLNKRSLIYQPSGPSPFALFVKTLNLTSVCHLTNDVVSSLVSNCCCLENLIIAKCKGLLSIDVISKLRNVTVLDCPLLTCLYVEASELQSLRYRGSLGWFSLWGDRDLKDAMLDFREGPSFIHFEFTHYDQLLRAIRDVKILTLSGWIFKDVIGPWFSSGHNGFRFSKLKDLWWIDNSMEEYKIDSLVSFLKICPSLERLFITIDPTSYSAPSTTGDCLIQVSTPTRLRHLKVVKVEGTTDDDDIVSLNERLLEVFNVEPRIVAETNGSHSRCLVRIPKHQSKDSVKMAENQSRIRKFAYKFVKKVEDNIGLCSKHAHMDL